MDHSEAGALLACQSDQAGPRQESPCPRDLLAREPPYIELGQALYGQIKELGKASFDQELSEELDETIACKGLGETLLQQELGEVETAIDFLVWPTKLILQSLRRPNRRASSAKIRSSSRCAA